MTSQQKILRFIQDLVNKLAVQKDYQQVLPMLDSNIVWIGIGEKGLYRGLQEVGRSLCSNQGTYQKDRLVSSDYQVTMMSDTVYIVTGTFLFLRDFLGQYYELKSEMTAVCKMSENEIRLYQIHWSVPGNLYERSEEQETRNRDFKVVTDTIPGGVVKCKNDDWYSILQMNDGFSDMLGYSAEEITEKFQNRFIDLIYPPDRNTVKRMIELQFRENQKIVLEYRMVCKDGTLIWILEQSQLVRNEEGDYFYSILLDNSANKRTLEYLKISLERHNIIMNQTNDIIFEWNIAEDNLTVSANWEKKFGYSPIVSSIKNNVNMGIHVHPEDQKIFCDLKQRLSEKTSYFEEACRISQQGGVYIWCRIRITILYDNERNPIRMIGVIIDIDREKKISEELTNRAERDLLTGLYNKETTRVLIEEELENQPESVSALMVLDLDNFKQVNDELGHFCGDKVLAEVASKLSSQFRTSDIIGRIGGDEFAVFLSNIPNHEFARKKGEGIIQTMQGVETDREHNIGLSCSVGISLAPAHGICFDELYRKADKALYTAKNQGKSCSCIYCD